VVLEVQLDNSVPPELVTQFQSQLAYCDPEIQSFDFSRLHQGVVMVQVPDHLDTQAVQLKVRKVADRIVSGGLNPPTQILHRVEAPNVRFREDFECLLKESGWVLQLGTGLWALTGPVARLVNVIDEDLRRLALGFGATEARYPAMLSLNFLNRIGYFSSFPQYTTFAFHLQPDVDRLDDFMSTMGARPAEVESASGEMSPSAVILAPAVCYHLYHLLADAQIPDEGIRVTAVGTCYRWESSNFAHLRRLWEFTMRELIIVGQKDLVLDIRKRAMQATLEYCEKLGLQAWIENANDPFFSPDAGAKSAYQRGYGMKWELRLPYQASGESVAAASFNNMQRTFGESCAITLANGETAFSGCIAFGLERWAYAFLAQHGVQPEEWPQQIRKRCEDG
jgi:seryl-tRNA synthetase